MTCDNKCLKNKSEKASDTSLGAMRMNAFIEPVEFRRQLVAYRHEILAVTPAPGHHGPLVPSPPEMRGRGHPVKSRNSSCPYHCGETARHFDKHRNLP